MPKLRYKSDATGRCQRLAQYRHPSIERKADGWVLLTEKERFGPFAQLVLANGAELTHNLMPATNYKLAFRGQSAMCPLNFN